jgi:hypothetical protein
VALEFGGLALAHVDRHLLPARLRTWDFSDVLGNVVNLAIPLVGFVLASRRPANRIGWLFLVAAADQCCSPVAIDCGHVVGFNPSSAGPVSLYELDWFERHPGDKLAVGDGCGLPK